MSDIHDSQPEHMPVSVSADDLAWPSATPWG